MEYHKKILYVASVFFIYLIGIIFYFVVYFEFCLFDFCISDNGYLKEFPIGWIIYPALLFIIIIVFLLLQEAFKNDNT